MRTFYLIIAAFALISCSKKSEEIKSETEQKVLRVMSYNIHHGTPINSANGAIELDKIAAVIKFQKPDLVALQEVDRNTRRAGEDQAKKLAESLGMYYYFSKSISYDGGDYGVAILSKFPLVSTEQVMLPNNHSGGEQRSLAIVTVDLPGGEKLRFASAHLDLVFENRDAQVRKLIDISKTSSTPLLVAGDFNALPESVEIGTLKQEFSLACSGSCPLTFPADKPTRSIDFIVSNPQAAKKLTKRSYQSVSGQLASDHLPLVGIYTY